MDLSTVTSFRSARSRDDLALAPGEAWLGGGTWLMSDPQPATSGLVDLTTLDWAPWEAVDGGLRIAATCTIEQVVEAPWPEHVRDVVRECADALLMSFKVQQVATVGGNVCLALPAGAMTALMVALDADVVVWTPDGGERRQSVASFVTGVRSTTLAPGEVVRAFEVASTALASRLAFRRLALHRLGRSSALVVGRSTDAGPVVTVTASTPRPYVVSSVSDLAGLDWYADAHGAADWRAAVTRLLVGQVLAELA
ncbi:FAD binding domain-containing protein [Nocardioides sp. C4-1]|uniref:FAD binding domain-containing protein n=1 Tax=Nocardioides sp. C4-1 TaxID=3151851 RepID=UPI003267150B